MRTDRGASLLDSLVASLIVGISTASLVSGWFFRTNVVIRTQHEGVALNLARRTMEEVKQLGFDNVPQYRTASPSITYYNNSLQSVASTSPDAIYTMKLVVEADRYTEDSPPQIDETALQLVKIVITLTATDEPILETSSYMVMDGV